MPNTYSQIFLQLIFAVRNREALITSEFELELHKYISGIIRNQGQKLFAINGTKDHIHLLISIDPSYRISDLVRIIKSDSSEWINHKRLSKFKFNWQEGYGAFSYGASQIQDVIGYINKQKEHHQRSGFREEYLQFLKNFEIQFDEKYIFEFFQNDAQDSAPTERLD